jgi:hypothetical protein
VRGPQRDPSDADLSLCLEIAPPPGVAAEQHQASVTTLV